MNLDYEGRVLKVLREHESNIDDKALKEVM
jgi:hypothetical protein